MFLFNFYGSFLMYYVTFNLTNMFITKLVDVVNSKFHYIK